MGNKNKKRDSYDSEIKKRPFIAWEPREGKIRNEPCKCGSGLKYKKCCLR